MHLNHVISALSMHRTNKCKTNSITLYVISILCFLSGLQLLTHWGWEIYTPFRRRHFQIHFFYENVWILIKISLKFVPKVPIDNIPALVQIMAWHWPGNKPLSEPMMFRLPTHICVTRPQLVNGFPVETVTVHMDCKYMLLYDAVYIYIYMCVYIEVHKELWVCGEPYAILIACYCTV